MKLTLLSNANCTQDKKRLFSFKKKKEPVIGIDISATSVKVIELSGNVNNYKVESYVVEPLPDGAVSEKNISELEVVGGCIRKAIRKSGSKAKLAAVAIPSSAAITKIIPMPNILSEDELEIQIAMDFEQYIPYQMEEVNLDFEVLGPCSSDENAVDVLIAASKTENVELRSAAVDLAGSTTKVVDIEPYTIEHAFELMIDQIENFDSEEPIAIVDIGATMTSFNIIEDGKLTYTREQVFGGKKLTEEIMKRYGLSYEDAGKVKKFGGLPDNYEPEVLEPFKGTIAQQISRFLQFFYSASEHDSVNKIILAGGCASITDLDEFIETNLGIETSVANPFLGLKVSPKIQEQKLYNDAPTLLIACGLAMRGFD